MTPPDHKPAGVDPPDHTPSAVVMGRRSANVVSCAAGCGAPLLLLEGKDGSGCAVLVCAAKRA